MTTPAQKKRRQQNLESFMQNEYHYFAHDNELKMRELNKYQFRFSNEQIVFDIYPSSKKYFDLVFKQWGTYETLDQLYKELKAKYRVTFNIK